MAQAPTTPAAAKPIDFAKELQQLEPAAGPGLSAEPSQPVAPVASAASRFGSNLGEMLNPVTIIKGLYEAVSNPIDTINASRSASEAERQKADALWNAGRYLEAMGHKAAANLPLIGPAAANVGEQIASGDVAGGLGAATGMLAPTAVGPALRGGRTVARQLKFGGPPPVIADAVQYGQSRGIPIDPGTATGNRFVKSVQKRVGDSMGGAGVTQDFLTEQAAALTKESDALATRAHPTAISPEDAGQAVRTAVTGAAERSHTAASTAYDRLRAIETAQGLRIKQTGGQQAPATSAAPFTDIPLAVDIAPTKAAMRPVYESLKRESQLAPLMGSKAQALYALDRLMSAPDMAPLSIADAALGDIKTIARVDHAFQRSVGQGVAAGIVTSLDDAVVAAAKQGPPGTLKALMEGRTATKAKHAAVDVLDQLRAEPVGVFNQATFAKDAGIQRLREVAKLAPKEMAQVGRAYLDDLFSTATSEGGFAHTDGLAARWSKLGPETKKLLFPSPGHVKDLDRFFLLAKKLGENPNPSGTAGVMTAMNVTSAPVMYAAAKLLYSPHGARVLLRGATIPRLSTNASKAWWAEVAQLVEKQAATSPSGSPGRTRDTAPTASSPVR